jgi:two-component system sensor histidine kinase CiaH
MFNKARLKLTAWYLLILMIISLSFSVVIYQGATAEIQRALSFQRFRIENPNQEFIFPEHPRRVFVDPDVFEETKNRIINRLLLINVIILVSSGTAGYFLAGRTLKPISKMIEEQNRFISDASHEIRTPLTGLITSTEVSLRDKKLTLAESKKVLLENLGELNGLKKLSDKLLELAYFQRPNGKVLFEEINLYDVLTEAVKKVKPLVKQKEISLILPKKISIPIKADFEKLVELAVILIDNAIKYSPEKSKIEIGLKKQKQFAVFSVKDFGDGIDPKNLPFIFDRFYRAEPSRNKKTDGYGLGLSIAKKIVENHGGKISVESKLNNGSTFIVQLNSDFLSKLSGSDFKL